MSHTDSASPINTIIIKIILHTYLTELVMAKEKADKIQINGEGHFKLAKK